MEVNNIKEPIVMERRRLIGTLAVDLALLAVLAWTGPQVAAVGEAITDPQRWLDDVGPDGAAVMAVGVFGWAVLLWVTMGLGLVAVTAVPSRTGQVAEALAIRLVPAALRRTAMVALGVSISTVAVAGP